VSEEHGQVRDLHYPKKPDGASVCVWFLGDRLAVFTEPLVIGPIFMAFVLFLPQSIWGTLVDKLPGGGSAGVKP